MKGKKRERVRKRAKGKKGMRDKAKPRAKEK